MMLNMRTDEKPRNNEPVLKGWFIVVLLSMWAIGTVVAQKTQEKAFRNPAFFTLNVEPTWNTSSYQTCNFGFKVGMNGHNVGCGWFLSAMTNFKLKGAFNTYTGSMISDEITTSYLNGVIGLTIPFKKNKVTSASWQLGVGGAYKTHNYQPHHSFEQLVHIPGEEEKGFLFSTGVMFDLSKTHKFGFLLSAECVMTVYSAPAKSSAFSGDRLNVGMKIGIGLSHHEYSAAENAIFNQKKQEKKTEKEQQKQKKETERRQREEQRAAAEREAAEREAAEREAAKRTAEQQANYANTAVDTIAKPVKTPASVTTKPVNIIKETSALVQGIVNSDGDATILEYGFCYSDSEFMPTMAHQHIQSSTQGRDMQFSATLENLTPNTSYYVRAYVINEIGISYSSDPMQFTTKKDVPLVNQANITGTTATSATAESEINAKFSNASERGFCYDTLPQPTVESGTITSGFGVGRFTAELKGLKPETNYYVRAYAISENTQEPVYGMESYFKTHPGLYTKVAYNVTDTSLVSGGYDLYDRGGIRVKEKGVCCRYKANPTIDNYRVRTTSWDQGEENKSWTSILRGLQPDKEYHIRAYVILENGFVLYGNDLQIRTVAR